MTSNKVLKIVQNLLKIKKIGFAGTLDPLGSGLLPIAINQATRTMPYIIPGKKEYFFKIKWGEKTDTDDSQGLIIKTSKVIPTDNDILVVLSSFLGKIKQTPPIYSALKVKGKRAYVLARKGQEFVLPSREVILEKLIYKENKKLFLVICSQGTYIRSLSRDLALTLGAYGHVTFLKRTKVGNFSINESISLEKVKKMGHKIFSSSAFFSIYDALVDIPAILIERELEQRVSHGNSILIRSRDYDILILVGSNRQILAVGSVQKGIFIPRLIFHV